MKTSIRITNARSIRKRLLGRRIVEVQLNIFGTGRGKGDVSTDPVFTLDDGSKLLFVVAETNVGTYGIDMMVVVVGKEK